MLLSSSLPLFHLLFFLPLLLFLPCCHITLPHFLFIFLFSLRLLFSSPSSSSSLISLSPSSSPEGVEELPDAMKPWKDLTDRFDELSIWLEELEERVESDLVKEVKEEEEEEVEGGGDPSDTIVKIKVSFENHY